MSDVYREAYERDDDIDPTLPSARLDDGELPVLPIVGWWRAVLELLLLDGDGG